MLANLKKLPLLLGALLVLGGNWSSALAAAPDRLLPDGTEVVLNINLKNLLESEAVKKHALEEIKAALKMNQISDILGQLNLDPLKDLHSMTVALGKIKIDPAGGIPQPEGDIFVILRGNFDLDKIHGTLADFARNTPGVLAIAEHAKIKVYEVKEAGEPMYAAFLAKDLMIAANKRGELIAAIDRSKGVKAARLSKEILTALGRTDDKHAIWMAVAMPDNLKALLKNAPMGAEIADKLEGLSLGATVKDDVKAQLEIHTTDKDTAARVRTAVDQGKALLTLAALEHKDLGPLLSDILSAVKIGNKDKAVTVRVEVDAETIDRLVKKLKELNPPK